jgi:predicted NAD/FAD-binding protein
MRVAVVGAGVSGLAAAHLLARAHDVTLFEREQQAGGHVRTVRRSGLALDTGFLVHNGPNYPLLTRLYQELGIAVQEAPMSFSVSCVHCGLEWSGRRPFAQRRRVADPRFVGLLWELARWLRTARRSLDEADYESSTLEMYVADQGYSERFRSHYLVPLTSALWSTAPERALEFPAAYAIRFFERHGMLGFRRFRWRSVSGGADRYVAALLARFPGALRLGVGVRGIRRSPDGVAVRLESDEVLRFDKVVVATHADQALRLLEDPGDSERALLGAWRSTRNEVALHTDSRLLPRARAARAAWNYQANGSTKPTITYSLNRLQRLETDEEWCVTLNRTDDIDPRRLVETTAFDHPLYTVESMRTQPELRRLSGERHTLYAGAYLGHGFHEDGFASGVRAAAALGVEW